MHRRKFILLLLLLVLSFAVSLPAQASFCRNYYNHFICILSIKRSAKYHWEYRASVSIDGAVRPIEIYNCRERVRVQQDGTSVPFQAHSSEELICSILKK